MIATQQIKSTTTKLVNLDNYETINKCYQKMSNKKMFL